MSEAESEGLESETTIDPYAAESPEEFFAVASEAFFPPEMLRTFDAGVFEEFRKFYGGHL